MIYNTANKGTLKLLDTIQNTALRLATGAKKQNIVDYLLKMVIEANPSLVKPELLQLANQCA